VHSTSATQEGAFDQQNIAFRLKHYMLFGKAEYELKTETKRKEKQAVGPCCPPA
jgi:hypothetical protein